MNKKDKKDKMDFFARVGRRNEFDASLVYGTRRFNLLTRRDRHMKYRNGTDNRWMNPETGILYDRYAQRRKCPLCGCGKFTVLFIKSGFPHVKCYKCELVYVTPILNKKEYEKLWSAEDSWETILESAPQIKMQALEAAYSLDIAELYIRKKKDIAICDVGCGPGTLLEAAKKRGYYVFGIEPNTRCHEILEKKGINYTGEFFPLGNSPENKFDCVFLLNTLEHLRDPLGTVLEAKKLLKPCGFIYISVPSINALVNRIMHEKAGVFGGHSHIQFFSIKTLSKLLEKTGFQVLEYETIITELGVIKNYLSFKDPYFGDSIEKLGFLTVELIYKNHLARNLNMLARLKNAGHVK